MSTEVPVLNKKALNSGIYAVLRELYYLYNKPFIKLIPYWLHFLYTNYFFSISGTLDLTSLPVVNIRHITYLTC